MSEMSVVLTSNMFSNDIKELIYKKLCEVKKIDNTMSEDIKSFHYIFEIKKLYYSKFGKNFQTANTLMLDLKLLVVGVFHGYTYIDIDIRDERVKRKLNDIVVNFNNDVFDIYNRELMYVWSNYYTPENRLFLINHIRECVKKNCIIDLEFTAQLFKNTRFRHYR
tara:strand:- start:745 stop:1239 length:495 start_codon:yes stop_codon:yes gene_type:complete